MVKTMTRQTRSRRAIAYRFVLGSSGMADFLNAKPENGHCEASGRTPPNPVEALEAKKGTEELCV